MLDFKRKLPRATRDALRVTRPEPFAKGVEGWVAGVLSTDFRRSVVALEFWLSFGDHDGTGVAQRSTPFVKTQGVPPTGACHSRLSRGALFVRPGLPDDDFADSRSTDARDRQRPIMRGKFKFSNLLKTGLKTHQFASSRNIPEYHPLITGVTGQ